MEAQKIREVVAPLESLQIGNKSRILRVQFSHYCPACGQELDNKMSIWEMKHCFNCGQKLDSSEIRTTPMRLQEPIEISNKELVTSVSYINVCGQVIQIHTFKDLSEDIRGKEEWGRCSTSKQNS